MKDLIYFCNLSSKTYISREYDTIMDFTDAVSATDLKCTDIDAIFFENTEKHFNSIKELYEHCISIMR